MFKKFLIIFLVSISQILFSQQGWYQLTSGTSNNLRSVYFTDVNTGYVVGYNGTILKTTNGGLNWISQQSGTAENLLSVHFIGLTGFNGGGTNTPTILKSTNGGTNWISQSPPGSDVLNSVFATDSATVYAAGRGKIVKTTNGGINWNIQFNDDLTCYYSIFFTNANTGYVIGLVCQHAGGRFMSTTNGGANWVSRSGDGILTFFTNSTTGYRISLGSAIFKTLNGGSSWTYQSLGNDIFLRSIRFTSETTGYTAGYLYPSNYAKIFKTTNSGLNWFEQIVPQTNQLHSIFFADANTGYAVGNGGTILKTTNGGVTGLNLIGNEIPKEYKLFQNYPNPFNPTTKIRFTIPNVETHSNASLQVFDILGRDILTLVNEELKPGTYEAEFNAENFSSGVYYYRLETQAYTETRKMIILK